MSIYIWEGLLCKWEIDTNLCPYVRDAHICKQCATILGWMLTVFAAQAIAPTGSESRYRSPFRNDQESKSDYMLKCSSVSCISSCVHPLLPIHACPRTPSDAINPGLRRFIVPHGLLLHQTYMTSTAAVSAIGIGT